MILGIAGTLGAGKGTVVEYLKTKGFKHYSISERLRTILKERDLPANRANLSALSDELSLKYQGGALYLAEEQAKVDNAQNYILEAIHRQSEADYVRSIGGLILGIDADVETRYARISKRQEGEKDNVNYEQFLADARREDEGAAGGQSNIRAVIKSADFVIDNVDTIEELHQRIDEVLEKIPT